MLLKQLAFVRPPLFERFYVGDGGAENQGLEHRTNKGNAYGEGDGEHELRDHRLDFRDASELLLPVFAGCVLSKMLNLRESGSSSDSPSNWRNAEPGLLSAFWACVIYFFLKMLSKE